MPNIQDIMDNKEIKEIKIFRRGIEENGFNPVLIFPTEKYKTPIEAIQEERIKDFEKTKKEFENRYQFLIQQMNNRNAQKEQYEQLEKIKNNMNE